MDQNPPAAADGQNPAINFLAQLDADTGLKEVMGACRAHYHEPDVVLPETETLQDGTTSYDALSHLILLSLNGRAVLPDQKVNVEYLRNEQRLVIPTGLGMTPAGAEPGRCGRHQAISDRYWRARTLTYNDIRGLVTGNRTAAQIRDHIDAIVLPAPNNAAPLWDTDAYYTATAGDLPEYKDMVFGTLSSILQLNYDIRDTGILNRADMNVSDSAWEDVSAIDPGRLFSKLKAYSMQCIAALNLTPCLSYALAAWTRAYGLSIGLLPSVTSLSKREWLFTSRMPERADREAINKYARDYQKPLITLCANLLALFGIMHLSKDHTYRTNDANMGRIGGSYIQTLRTEVQQTMIDQMDANREAILRTAQHPFGLAQTYWLARAMHSHGKLTSPLAVRIDSSPPPVQRLMVADATAQEWANLPAGRAVDTMFEHGYAQMRQQIAVIKLRPPAYSSLHKLYGVEAQSVVPADVWTSVEAMMPTVYGYIMTNHKNEKGELDGLGFALSLKNVEREKRGLVNLWMAAWEKYSGQVEDAGIMDFVKHIAELRDRGVGPRTQ